MHSTVQVHMYVCMYMSHGSSHCKTACLMESNLCWFNVGFVAIAGVLH